MNCCGTIMIAIVLAVVAFAGCCACASEDD